MMNRTMTLTGVVLVCSCGFGFAGEAPPEDARAAGILTRAAEHLRGMKAYAFEFKSVSITTAEGMRTEYDATYAVSVERPDRVALRFLRGTPSNTAVSDGKEWITYEPIRNIYMLERAPAEVDLLLSGPGEEHWAGEVLAALRTPGLRTAITADPLALLEPLIASVRYVGEEVVNDVRTHHIAGSIQGLSSDVWISVSDPPLLMRSEVPDAPEDWSWGGLWKDLKRIRRTDFSHWKAVDSFAPDAFRFTPPSDAKKVKSFMDDMVPDFGGEPEPAAQAPLVGDKAPVFKLELLGGGMVDLAELSKQNKVVVLDFWATWCPPCRRGLPIIEKVSQGYKEEQVGVYAVNLREDAATIKPFLEKAGLKLTVALDTDGAIAEKYGVEGIPQTVLIGKDGTVQAVHVGFTPDLQETLKTQIDSLVAGKNLSAAPGEKLAEGADGAKDAHLEAGWTARGSFQGLAVDHKSGSVYASGPSQIEVFDAKGERVKKVPARGESGTLRLANLRADAGPEFLIFRTWGRDVDALDGEGKALWSYPAPTGVDDVWAADLNGDGLDEVIVGFNGDGGLHALTPEGKLLWKDTTIGNVWHVTACRDGEKTLVVTTSAMGKVHVFDAKGKRLRDLQAPMYANMVRAGFADEAGPGIFVVGSGAPGRGASVARLDLKGQVKWTLDLPGKSAHCLSMAASATAPFATVGMADGMAYLLDTKAGKIVATTAAARHSAESAFLPVGEGERPAFVVVTATGLAAFKVKAE